MCLSSGKKRRPPLLDQTINVAIITYVFYLTERLYGDISSWAWSYKETLNHMLLHSYGEYLWGYLSPWFVKLQISQMRENLEAHYKSSTLAPKLHISGNPTQRSQGCPKTATSTPTESLDPATDLDQRERIRMSYEGNSCVMNHDRRASWSAVTWAEGVKHVIVSIMGVRAYIRLAWLTECPKNICQRTTRSLLKWCQCGKTVEQSTFIWLKPQRKASRHKTMFISPCITTKLTHGSQVFEMKALIWCVQHET